jgi:hypothetical protein
MPRRLSERSGGWRHCNGQWDAKRRRILGVDRGDIVIIDTVSRSRIDVTRTTGNESSPAGRAATHVTSCDNSSFIVPIESAAPERRAVDRRRRRATRESPTARNSQGRRAEDFDWVEQEAAAASAAKN